MTSWSRIAEPRAGGLSRARALGVLGAGAAAFALPSRARAAEALRVGATANDTYAEAYYAYDRGLFARAGLDVTITTFSNGGAVTAAVAGGAIDVGVCNPLPLANAAIHGLTLVYIAGGGLYSSQAPTTTLCVARHSPVTTPRDLAGKIIAVSALRDTSSVATEAWLARSGVDPSTVRFVELPFSEMAPGLTQGRVAAALISEPSLTAAQPDVRTLGKAYDGIAKEFMISGWFTTRDLAAQRSDALRRFTAAIYGAARWANANHEQSGAILAKYAKLDPRSVRAMARCLYATSLDPARIQPILDAAARYKAIDRPVSAAELIS